MSSDCSSQIEKTIKAASSDSFNFCNPPPPFMSEEVCEQIMKMRNNMQAEANKRAQSSKYDGINASLMNLIGLMGCDDACQKRRKADELRKKWNAAKKVETEAPGNTEDAERNYYVYTEGETGWKNRLVQRYTVVANKNKAEALKKHKQLLDEINTLISDYKGETDALRKIKALLKIRLNENKELKAAVDSQQATTQTNDRKVVYEDWAQVWLGTIKSLLTTIYIVLAIVYLVWGPFLENSEYKTLKGWIKPLVLIVLPFTIYYIVQFLYFIKSKIAWWLDNKAPKDVYRDLNN